MKTSFDAKLQQILTIIRPMTLEEASQLCAVFGHGLTLQELWELVRDNTFTKVVLDGAELNRPGAMIIQAIKAVRANSNGKFGLKEAKDLVDASRVGLGTEVTVFEGTTEEVKAWMDAWNAELAVMQANDRANGYTYATPKVYPTFEAR